MQRNYLKGFIGDEINLLLAASAFNFKKWMNNFLKLLFMLKIALMLHALVYTKNTQREKYLALFLMVLKLW